MYGDRPDRWDEGLLGWDRLRFIINVFTRLRYCDSAGRIALQYKNAPGTQPAPWRPWFRIPERRSREQRIVFGHWSTLGVWDGDGVIALDSGCLWGHTLTAVRLDGAAHEFIHVPCPRYQIPGR